MYQTTSSAAFVPGCRHDIFVSYASVDDVPLAGAEMGWVTTLVKNLETRLAQKLGRRYAPPWMDHQLAGNEPLTTAILSALRETATLLVIVSRGYLESDWCRREREAFLQLVRERSNGGSRVFVVQVDKVDRLELPNELSELRPYKFWMEDPEGKAPRTLGIPAPRKEEPEYYNLLNNLSQELANELERLKGSGKEGDGNGRAGITAASVFLAEVTDDLESLREEMRSHLLQAGLAVLPTAWYPRHDLIAYQQAMAGDLSQSRLFVQLLSGVAGKRPPDWPLGYPSLQYEVAKQSRLPILQWRSRELDPASVRDPSHKTLLESNTVRATGLEEFKRAVVVEAKRETPAPAPPRDDLVFVNSDSSDRDLAERLSALLLKHNIGSVLPLKQGEPSDIRKDLEANLRDCDGLIVVYGETHVSWVRNQLRQGRKIIAQRDQPLRCLAVCEGPPPDKDDVAFNLPQLKSLNFRNGFDEQVLIEFIQCLRS